MMTIGDVKARNADMCSGKWPRRTVNRSRGKLGSVDNVWWCSPGKSKFAFFQCACFTKLLTIVDQGASIAFLLPISIQVIVMLYLYRLCLHPSPVLLGICAGCWFPTRVPLRAALAPLVVPDFCLRFIQIPGPGEILFRHAISCHSCFNSCSPYSFAGFLSILHLLVTHSRLPLFSLHPSTVALLCGTNICMDTICLAYRWAILQYSK